MAAKKITHLSLEERAARGAEARTRTPVSSHKKWRPAADRPDPVALLEEQNIHPGAGPGAGPARADDGLAVHLLPGRGQDHGGGPEGHADRPGWTSSCAATPICRTSGCSPRRSGSLLFDLNDFDETLPGPFEYDVKRMAASFTIAARNNGFAKADARAVTLASVRGLPGGDGRVRRRWARWTSGTPTWTRTSS